MDDLEGQDIFAEDFIQEEAVLDAMSHIQQFFNGTTVLVTGCTSFLGKSFVEKLLRSTDVKKVHVLVRQKEGKASSERVKKLFDSKIFENLKIERPSAINKVCALPGDIAEPDLGLSPEDREMLLVEVDLIFHLAGSSPFDTTLRTAVTTNIRGTKEILRLAKDMRCLKAAIFLSTVFSNCVNDEINEKFYASSIGHEELVQLISILNDKCLESLQPSLIGPWPNVFTFTKQITEEIIEKCNCGLPFGVVRPGLVSSIAYQPLKGWLENLKGPQSVAYGCYTGLIRAVCLNKAAEAPIVPVDMVTNAILALAWDIGVTRGNRPSMEQLSYNEALLPEDNLTALDVPILNLVPSSNNVITWGTFIDHCQAKAAKLSTRKKMLVVTTSFLNNRFLIWVLQLFWHWIPAIIYDMLLRISGQTPRFFETYKKVHNILDSCSYIYLTSWKFQDSNSKMLWDKLSRKDKIVFNFNIARMDWYDYMETYMKGIRKYIAKDDVNIVKEERPSVIRQYFENIGGKYMVMGLILYLICVALSTGVFIRFR